MYRRPCLSSLILSSFQREGTVSDTDVLPRGASADSVRCSCRVSRKYWGRRNDPTLGGRETLKTLLTGRYSRASFLKQMPSHPPRSSPLRCQEVYTECTRLSDTPRSDLLLLQQRARFS